MSRRFGKVATVVVALVMVVCVGYGRGVGAEEHGGAALEAHRDAPQASVAGVAAAASRSRQTTAGTLAQLRLYFIENRGQLDQQVAYYVQGNDKTLYFTSQGVTFALTDRGSAGEDDLRPPRSLSALASRWIVKLEFVGANTDVQPVGVDETGALISYFKGQREEWVTGAKAYSGVVYRDLWPGIDLEYRGLVNELKYQFVVRPGADPSQIQLAYRGATEVAVDEAGRLQVSTPLGGFEDDAPYAYQQAEGGEQLPVNASYEFLPSSHEYSFRVGDYDGTKPLILDPTVLNYCGYLGGLGEERAQGIAVDGDGNAYITGYTHSTHASFPVTVGPDQTHNGDADAFVAKVMSDGSGLVYCGYIGGSALDEGHAIAVDSSGHAYIAGYTHSDETEGFPAAIGPYLSHGGKLDVFVAKVKPDGTDLLYCGYIGGAETDKAYAIAVDSSGSAYVAGQAVSAPDDGFPVSVGPDLTYAGVGDAFVAKVHADGSGLEYCGYIGGGWEEQASAIAVDGLGSVHVAGFTYSIPAEGFPVTVGPDVTHNGGQDGFVAKVISDGSGLDYCGYIGGSGYDSCEGIAVDSSGNAYVSGQTSSDETTFPEAVGPDLTYNGGGSDAFVAKVRAGGGGLDYCGYIGGSDDENGQAAAVDGEGRAHVTGYTISDQTTFPVVDGPDLTWNGWIDAFVARVSSDGTQLDYCGYIGGAEADEGTAIALDGEGNAYVSGVTWSSEAEGFPVAIGPDYTFNGGNSDAFVARVGENRAPTLGPVTPSKGGSGTGVTVYITTTWKDADGCQDLKQCYFHIGASPSLANNVTLMYNARKNKLWLLDDTGTTWTGGHAPGSAKILGNSQAKVYCSATDVAGLRDTLRVRWAIEFQSTYTGAKKTGLKCKDAHKAKAKGAWKGTWTIE